MQRRGRFGELARAVEQATRYAGGKYVEVSERAAHGMLGESPDNPKQQRPSLLQNAAAHGVAYATSPLLGLMEAIIPPKRKPAVESSASKQLPAVDMAGGKGKRAKAKKARKGTKRPPPTPPRGRKGSQRSKQKSEKEKETSLSGKPDVSIEKAPVSVGVTGRNMGMLMHFYGGTRPGCMRIRGACYVGDLCVSTSGTSNFVTYAVKGDTTKLANSWSAMPSSSYYFGPPVSVFSQLFERYRVRTKIEYRPRVSSATGGCFKILYNEDPMAMWALTGKSERDYGTPALALPNAYSTADISGFPMVTEGAVWRNFETGWSHVQTDQDLNYTTAPSYTSYIDPSNIPMYDVRQAKSGIWSFGGVGFSSQGDTKTTSYGEIWVHYDLSLCDIVTSAYTQAPTLTSRKTIDSNKLIVDQVLSRLRSESKERHFAEVVSLP
jgi:hypothetical protein